jgi:hypothetical protein
MNGEFAEKIKGIIFMSKNENQNTEYKIQKKAKEKNDTNFIVAIIIFFFLLLFKVSEPESVVCSSAADSKLATSFCFSSGESVALSPDVFSIPSDFSFEAKKSSILGDLRFASTEILNSIINKIHIVESNGKSSVPVGDNGKAVGPLQLHQCVLDDVNKYYGMNFQSGDRKDLEKSKLIARAYIIMWILENQEEIAVRIFNGGPRGWEKPATEKYWQKYLATEKN